VEILGAKAAPKKPIKNETNEYKDYISVTINPLGLFAI